MHENIYNLIDKIGNLGEINIVLNLLRSGVYERWALRKTISRSCGITTKILLPDALINILFAFGLVTLRQSRSKELIALSKLGNSFVELEYNKTDRLTKKQGVFLLVDVFRHTPIVGDLHLIIKNLNKDPEGNLWINPKDRRVEEKLEIVLKLLQQLKVANYQDGKILIKQEYLDYIIETITWDLSIDEESFASILEQNRRLGEMAEEYVMVAEKDRLIKLGRRDLAESVKIISKNNVAAGYDIESFDGDGLDILPDRFIEVKGNLGNKSVFYITRNELEVSKKKGNTYWLYCVVNMISEKERKLYLIQNPQKAIFEERRFKSDPMLWKCFM